MDFFIPFAKDAEETKSVLASVRAFVSKEMAAELSDEMFFSVNYVHNGNAVKSEVDKPEPHTGEPVIMILFDKLRGLYLVCTPNRGVIRGMPIMVGQNEIVSVKKFD